MHGRLLTFALFALAACGGAPASQPCPRPPPAPVCPAASRDAPAETSMTKMTPKELLEKLFTEPHADPAWFEAEFLRQVPAAKVDEIHAQLAASLGKLQHIEATPDVHVFEVVFERGSVTATIVLVEGMVQTLLIRPGQTAAPTLEQATAQLAAPQGRSGFVVLAGDKALAEHQANEALAVGSSFKLAVLAELRDRVEKEKKLAWDRVVPLDPAYKSLPSGMLQEWPDRSPLTVQTLASLMISISDNTATDAVIRLVGRASLAKYGGAAQVRPFLATGDVFRLKAKGNEALLERFRKATSAEREKILAELEKLPLPKVEDYPKGATALDVEWFFSPAELCALMAKVHDLPLMSINPGVAKRSDWDRVAYKGGSEPGVINMTTWLQKGNKSYCVSATWNDAAAPIEESRFVFAYGGVLAFLAKNLP